MVDIRWIRVRRFFFFVNYCKLHIEIGLAGGMYYGDLKDDGGVKCLCFRVRLF